MRRRAPCAVLPVLLVLAATALPAADPPAASTGSTGTIVDRAEPSRAAVDARDLPEGWYARVATSEGEFVIRLHPEQAPQSVAHFAALAEGSLPWTDSVTGEQKQGHYYDGQTVFYASAGQRFETGCPYGTGHGSPRLFVPLEEVGQPIDFSRPWRVGMTRAPLGRISAAQFFVTAGSQPLLTPRHPCFGTVVAGKESVFRITSVATYSNGRPIEPVVLEQVRVFSVGSPEPLPEPVPYQPPSRSLQPLEGLSHDK
jgi:peptidyl-prolyl cis-trans isomerase A (cyclophilin A)